MPNELWMATVLVSQRGNDPTDYGSTKKILV